MVDWFKIKSAVAIWKEERGRRKEERRKRKEERGKRKEERMASLQTFCGVCFCSSRIHFSSRRNECVTNKTKTKPHRTFAGRLEERGKRKEESGKRKEEAEKSSKCHNYYMAESIFAMRLANLRSVTCYTDQNF